MNVLKKLLGIVVASSLLGFATLSQAGDWSKVRIGVEGAYPPFSQVEPDGSLVGFDIDIANALCAEIGAECELITQDWDGIIPALLARKYDAIIASMSITEERKEKVAFTNKYYTSPVRFAAKKGSASDTSKEGLKGKAIGVQRATVSDTFATGEYGDAEIKRYSTQDEAYLDAIAGRIDFLLADALVMDDGFLKTEQGADFEFVGPLFSDEKYFGPGIGIATRKKDADLVDLLNQAIDTIRTNGVYKELNDKYFTFDVYGE